jgi:hypothetical protein
VIVIVVMMEAEGQEWRNAGCGGGR